MLKEVANKLAADLERTCSLAKASRLTGVPKGSIRYLIDQVGVLETVEVAGRERVTLSSFKLTKQYIAGRTERMRERNKRAALSPRASLGNLLRGKFGVFITNPFDYLQVFIPVPEARRIIGVSYGVFNRWCREGKLRKKNLRGVWYIEGTSMKSLRARTISIMKKLRLEV